MSSKINKNLVSPARELTQKSKDKQRQQSAREYYGEPAGAEVSDAINAMKTGGPTPTLFNVTTGEWEQVDPYQARTMGVPIGPSSQDILNRMWRGGENFNPLPMYGSDIRPT